MNYFSKTLTSIVFAAAMGGVAGFAYSQSEGVQQFGTKAGQLVNDAQIPAKAGQYDKALAKLNTALGIPDISAYEVSTIHSIAGQYYYEQENYDQAIISFEKSLNAGGLTPEAKTELEGHIGRLLIANKQYSQGAERLEVWVRKTGDKSAKNVEYIMQAWLQSEEYKKALPWAELWFDQAQPKDRRHFDLMNFLYNNLGLYGRQADIVKDMIIRWPDEPDLWNNWVSLLAQGGREKDAFEVNKMMYQQGLLSDENGIKKIVEYYQYYEMPYQGGQILEYEMNAGRVQKSPDNLVRLSELYRQAREYKRALPILKLAAEKSGRAKSWAQYGEALYHQGQCEDAEGAFRTAMNKGYDRGKSWLLIANCWYERGQGAPRPECIGAKIKDPKTNEKLILNGTALAGFKKVPVSTPSYGDAQKWVDFVETENQSYPERCQEILEIKIDSCMIKIEGAVKLTIVRGGFFLEEKDQHCTDYIELYEQRYGPFPDIEE